MLSSEMWSTTAAKIRSYIGFHILMGMNHLPEKRVYWAKDEKLQFSPMHLGSPAVSLKSSPDTCILQATGSYHQGESQGTIGYRNCSLSSLQGSSSALHPPAKCPR